MPPDASRSAALTKRKILSRLFVCMDLNPHTRRRHDVEKIILFVDNKKHTKNTRITARGFNIEFYES